MLRGQDPAPGDLGDQTLGPSGSASSRVRDSPPVPRRDVRARGLAANAPTPDPLSGSGRTLSAAAAGRPFPGSTNSQLSGLNSIARNRLQREFAGAPEAPLNYPDIHDDPAKIYHDRFGIEEEHDRFAFPWLMNLIFEDRWLLAEKNPSVALQNQLRRRMRVDIRDPDPDTANFPNGAYTLPKGRVYIENSPLGLYGRSAAGASQYNWEYLFRYGMTDNLEFRIFSNGLTATQGRRGTVGFSPLAFDFKINFWEENTRYWLPAMGVELYIQTTFGSPAFNSGTQPSLNLLFDHTLPLGFSYEHNVGISGTQGILGENVYQFSYQWSLQRQVVQDFDVFWQGFYNATALPRVRRFSLPQLLPRQTINPTPVVTGVGAIWTLNDNLALFGSYNFGLTRFAPATIALFGFAVAF
jgi:hypothetical protein